MVTAKRFYQAGVAGPAGNPGVKDAHEQEQLDHAVENILKAHGKTRPWRWV